MCKTTHFWKKLNFFSYFFCFFFFFLFVSFNLLLSQKINKYWTFFVLFLLISWQSGLQHEKCDKPSQNRNFWHSNYELWKFLAWRKFAIVCLVILHFCVSRCVISIFFNFYESKSFSKYPMCIGAGCIGTCAASCAGSCFGTLCGKVSSFLDVKSKTTKYPYVILMLLTAILCMCNMFCCFFLFFSHNCVCVVLFHFFFCFEQLLDFD